MAPLNPTFILGLVVVAYLLTFIIFAVLRVLTGISIQRIGYFSLRRVSYTSKIGVEVKIRGLGLNLHRPTFAQPTWLSIVLTGLSITVDLKTLENEKARDKKERKKATRRFKDELHDQFDEKIYENFQNETWKRLTAIKERLKRLQRSVKWLSMVDLVATNSILSFTDIGTIQIGSFTLAVDIRTKMMGQGRIFSRFKESIHKKSSAEWIFTTRSMLFIAEGRDPIEILDHATLNIQGLLSTELDGLQDTSISLKLGRVHIPYDDMNKSFNSYKLQRKVSEEKICSDATGVLDTRMVEEFNNSSFHEENLSHTFSESKELFSSILRGIREVQFIASHIGFTKKYFPVQQKDLQIYLNISMKEIGIDLNRLDQKSPAHRMYFSSKDIAHQALAAAFSIAIGVDDSNKKTERILYIPMATTTIRTTFISKVVEISGRNSADERNANILFANVVITSPSVDLNPKILTLVSSITQLRPSPIKKFDASRKHRPISRLLPKANIKFSMHEPVIRVTLPPVEKNAQKDDFDLIISSVFSISLDIESSHSSVGDLHYSLGSTFRLQSHALYYQKSSGAHHELLETESFELKTHIRAKNGLNVVVTGILKTFSVHIIRSEIIDGIRQIMRQFHFGIEPGVEVSKNFAPDLNYIRELPAWLVHFSMQVTDFSIEVAGIDETISDETRGVALQLESWTVEYYILELETSEIKSSRRRYSRSTNADAETLYHRQKLNQQKPESSIHGRKLLVQVRELEVFIVESSSKWEQDPFVAMPKFECTFSTTRDNYGPVSDIALFIKYLLIKYSLYRHYSCGVATMILRRAFMRTKDDQFENEKILVTSESVGANDYLYSPTTQEHGSRNFVQHQNISRERISIHLRATLLQIQAQMPSDPSMMIQIYNIEAEQRGSNPFLSAKFIRIFAEAPKIRRVWARIVSIKNFRIDYIESRHENERGEIADEKIFDIYSEAIRLAIPHQLVMYQVVDNLVNTLKSIQQLHHRFFPLKKEHTKQKLPVGPRKIPNVIIRSKAFLFELEDGAFEWKLGVIYRNGLLEQAQRLARQAVFDVKARKVREEMRKETIKIRSKVSIPRDRGKTSDRDCTRSRSRSRSDDDDESIHSQYLQSHQSNEACYSSGGTCKITSFAKITTKEAYQNLLIYNSQSWKRRIDQAFNKTKIRVKKHREMFWGTDELPEEIKSTEEILQIPQRPALMEFLVSNPYIKIEKPSFPLSKLPDFMNRIGKGMPYDMKYALLVPMHIQIDMGETRASLRDYPLPLIHIPAMKSTQYSRLPTWSLKGDFVIAEEFRDSESSRNVRIDIVPPHGDNSGRLGRDGFAIDVCRTISPVKSYSDVITDINTAYPTHITWGSSFQPAIQDMMMIIETFTKPQIDPSDRSGFWDKIRLSFHSRINLTWKNNGDVHLLLKGTRDPYAITGYGAGFLMCWRNNVHCEIRRSDDPRKLIIVKSGEYILAVPDYSIQAPNLNLNKYDIDDMIGSENSRGKAAFKKVVMKLSGNVQWLAGVMFERNLAQPGQRSFEFKPHYDVVLKRPDCAKSSCGAPYDAYQDFRSNHIHLSIAVKAPMDGEFPVSDIHKLESYNTVHLSPRFFSHFYAWWSMFGGAISLPIRQGSLWPGVEKSSKKFARHLASIKYNILLAPIFVSHIYKHNDSVDYNPSADSATGLKIKLDNFMLDVHQRKEELHFNEKDHKTQDNMSGMKMHQAQLDLLSADIRAMTASFPESNSDKSNANENVTHIFQSDEKNPDLSLFDIPGNDMGWIDVDDFVELDWDRPLKSNPETKILPLAYAPRFTYFRETDHQENHGEIRNIQNLFGSESTHFCYMTKDDDPLLAQYELVKKRKDQLQKQMKSHSLSLNEADTNIAQDSENESLKAEVEKLKKHHQFLRDKNQFLESMMQRLENHIRTSNRPNGSKCDLTLNHDEEISLDKVRTSSIGEFSTEISAKSRINFNNRFMIHNMQLKWNNLLRNIILRYIHQVSQRRGIVYYMSRRAVKFILDIVQEQKRPKNFNTEKNHRREDLKSTFVFENVTDSVHQDIEESINDILSEAKKNLFTSDKETQAHNSRKGELTDNLNSDISGDFLPMNSYHLHLIAPQIQLQSEKNPMAVVLVTAKGMKAKIIEVMDKDRIYDNVSGLVQRRFSVEMDSIQFFVTHQEWFSSQLLSMYSGNHYGVSDGSAWPPWVPMEVMFDFKTNPFGFKRVVQKTSASLRYDKYNTLRLKYNDEIGSRNSTGNKVGPKEECRMDHVWVEFPKIHAICNSAQYYAMYIIVMDLLMYSEPQEKTRTERLEKIILASDFSDLRGVPEKVTKLQERIRYLEEIKTHFQINPNCHDKKVWGERLLLDRDLNSCANELFFMMKAITTSQRKFDASKTSGLMRWNICSQQIIWHLIRDNNEPLLEFQLQRAEYDRTDNSDGSHNNLIQVGKIIGLNLLPDSIYPEIIAPYLDMEGKAFNEDGNHKMLRVYWYMLEAIAGIPVMDLFEVKLFPLKIQLERDIGKKLFDYIFPGSSDTKKKSPFIVKHMQSIPDSKDKKIIGNNISKTQLEDPFTEKQVHNLIVQAEKTEKRSKVTLSSEHRQLTASSIKNFKNVGFQPTNGHHFRLFQTQQLITPSTRNLSKKIIETSSETYPPLQHSESLNIHSTSLSDPKTKRFSLGRHNSRLMDKKSSDDLTKMMGRASSYMTLAHVKISSVVLCLSYKGKGERNLEDIHNLVFRLPDIEYRNKTWSNLDLALAFKRDVIRSLISHTGAIVANKFKHRPNISQQHRLRELAANSLVLATPNQETSYDNSDTTSSLDTSLKTTTSVCERSNSSSSQESIQRSLSYTSVLSKIQSLPSELAMTPTIADTPTRDNLTTLESKRKSKSRVLGRLMKRSVNSPNENTLKQNEHDHKKKIRRSLKLILGDNNG